MSLSRTREPEVMDSVQEAEDYDNMDHADVNRRFVDDYLAFSSPDVHQSNDNATLHILDLGTGTAQIPILLSSRLTVRHTVIACDLSKQMLEVARQNISAAGCSQAVIPILCNARRLPVPNNSCQQLISNSIIHHIPNPADAFSEIHRVVAPHAVVYIRDLLRPDTTEEVDQLVKEHAGTATRHQQKMFKDSLHAALTMREVRTVLVQNGLNPDWVNQSSDRHWTIAGRMPVV
ncbi:MAG: class I SAM-dependent methyltransferase [Fuerstiella sp.]|nr:class I SAM-dependent methyltransferase [Fuerstiella sp.]